jgi:hypothetical protein
MIPFDGKQNIIPTLIFVRMGMEYCRMNHESSPVYVRIPAVRTPKLQEKAFPEDVCSVVIEIK